MKEHEKVLNSLNQSDTIRLKFSTRITSPLLHFDTYNSGAPVSKRINLEMLKAETQSRLHWIEKRGHSFFFSNNLLFGK